MYKATKIFKNLLKSPLWGLGGFFFLLPLWGPGVFSQNLEDYLQTAAKNNPTLQAEYAEFEAAMQKAQQVSGLPDPTLTMSAFGQRVETRLGPQEAKFTLMQMFPWFGTLKSKGNAATLMAEAKFQLYLDKRNKLFFEVSKKYYNLFALQESIWFQQNNLKILKDYKELALAEVRSGSGSLADVLRTEQLIDKTKTKLAVLKMKKTPMRIEFNNLLNRDKKALVKIPKELDAELSPIEIEQDSLFQEHPKIKSLVKMQEAMQFKEIAAKKNGMPKLGVGLSYGIIGKRTRMNPPGNGRDVIVPMVSISLPIFRGKYKAAKKEAQLMQESYAKRKIAVKNKLFSKFAAAVFKFEKAKKMLDLYEKQVKNSEQILDLLLISYQNATGDFEELLRTRQELLNYQLAMAESKVEYRIIRSKIKYLIRPKRNR